SWLIFILLLATNSLLAFLTFALGLADEMAAAGPATATIADIPQWILGLANAGMILLLYGVLGALGLTLSKSVNLPGVFRRDASRRELLLEPLVLGVLCGGFFIVVDLGFSRFSGWGAFAHPDFPASIIASATAGIGEEIVFRLFMLTLWVFLLNLIIKRSGTSTLKRWMANVIAALAFAAAHIPSAMFLLGASTVSEIPVPILIELMLLNSVVALIAGDRYLRVGLVAAVGVHFWTDIVWHVIYPLTAL
ncbi:MAG: CPBP family glutamic-type intramembrane protease, partial [Anaerolineales bacterium]